MMNSQPDQPAVPSSETWTCTECGAEVAGPTVPERRWLVGKKFRTTDGGTVLTRCASCGKTLCQGCTKKLVKGSWPVGNMLSPCPQCKARFGDGPVLIPAAWAADYDRAGIGLQAAAHVRTLKNWSQWVIFWSLVNLGSAILLLLAGDQSGDAAAPPVPQALLALLLATSIIALIASMVCLGSRIPWPGFYVIFSLYLVFLGIMNAWSGTGFWRTLGVVQILLGLWCMRDAKRYGAVRPKTGD